MIYQEVAAVLQKIGTAACLQKAAALESQAVPVMSLHLRGLGLQVEDAEAIAVALERCFSQHDSLYSISFSYNCLLGNQGVIALVNSWPHSICEVGLVGCGMGDIAAEALLRWMEQCPRLRMVCIEQNNISHAVKAKMQAFSSVRPLLTLIV